MEERHGPQKIDSKIIEDPRNADMEEKGTLKWNDKTSNLELFRRAKNLSYNNEDQDELDRNCLRKTV